MSVAEFLLELTGESLLHLVEVAEERNWDEDNNSLLAVSNFELV